MSTHVIKRQLLMDLFQILDLILVGGAFVITMALMIRPFNLSTLLSVIDMRISLQNSLFLTLYSVICHIIFHSSGMYNSHRLHGIFKETGMILKAATICTAVLFVGYVQYDISIVNVWFINFFWLSLVSLFILNRLFLRSLLVILRTKGHNLRNVLIVGKNTRSEKCARNLMAGKRLGYKFLGYVDVRPQINKNRDGGDLVVSDFNNLQEFVRKNVVDEIFLYLPIKSFYKELNDIITVCEEQGITVRMCTDLFMLKTARAKIEQVDSDMLITLFTGNMQKSSILIKEFTDYILAVVFIILSSPVMLIAIILIKILSPGPVFFRQERIGLHKRRFKIIKFRTMYIDAESRLEKLAHLNEMGSNGAFKITNDPRVTPIGKILRKLSIDELPQFFNVLMGDMSVIGPRPLTVRDFNGFSIDTQRRRFSVKPGLTCLWQVRGRNKVSFDDWMKLDMEYIDNWSLLLDLKILIQTVGAVVTAKGAN